MAAKLGRAPCCQGGKVRPHRARASLYSSLCPSPPIADPSPDDGRGCGSLHSQRLAAPRLVRPDARLCRRRGHRPQRNGSRRVHDQRRRRSQLQVSRVRARALAIPAAGAGLCAGCACATLFVSRFLVQLSGPLPVPCSSPYPLPAVPCAAAENVAALSDDTRRGPETTPKPAAGAPPGVTHRHAAAGPDVLTERSHVEDTDGSMMKGSGRPV